MIAFPVSRFLVALLFFQALCARAEVPKTRLAHLSRGVNVTGWLSQISRLDYTQRHFDAAITDHDLELIRSLGFDHVRLCIDPRLIGLDHPDFKFLDQAVRKILGQGLAVVLDMHPYLDFEKSLVRDAASVDAFSGFWAKVSSHYSGSDPDKVFFQILNEPEFELRSTYPGGWPRALARIASVIRKNAPRQTIIAAGCAGVEYLPDEPLPDSNVIYDFHFYAPGIFTHQGAPWGNDYYRFLRRVPYPLTPKDLERILAQIPDQKNRDEFMHTYGSPGWKNSIVSRSWDRTRIEERVSEAAEWSRKHRVPVICEEFGAYPKYAEETARAAWTSDARLSLEKFGIGWAVWDYNNAFAIVKNGKPDNAIAKALGLNRKPRKQVSYRSGRS